MSLSQTLAATLNWEKISLQSSAVLFFWNTHTRVMAVASWPSCSSRGPIVQLSSRVSVPIFGPEGDFHGAPVTRHVRRTFNLLLNL